MSRCQGRSLRPWWANQSRRRLAKGVLARGAGAGLMGCPRGWGEDSRPGLTPAAQPLLRLGQPAPGATAVGKACHESQVARPSAVEDPPQQAFHFLHLVIANPVLDLVQHLVLEQVLDEIRVRLAA